MPCLSRRCHLFARAPPLGKHPDGVAPRIMARSGKQIGKRGDSPGRNHGEPARNRLNFRGRDRYAIGDVERGCRALEKRSEEHTSELPALMRITYAVFCLKKKRKITT